MARTPFKLPGCVIFWIVELDFRFLNRDLVCAEQHMIEYAALHTGKLFAPGGPAGEGIVITVHNRPLFYSRAGKFA